MTETSALEIAAAAGAILVAALALGAVILLRHVRSGEPQASPAA